MKIKAEVLSIDFEEKTITLILPDTILKDNSFVAGIVDVDLSNIINIIKE